MPNDATIGGGMHDIVINELMTKTVTCVCPETDVAEVARLLRDQRLSCAVVIENNVPVGIITERDLVRHVADTLDHPTLRERLTRDLMSAPPVTIREHDRLYDALVISRAQGIRHLPVVNENGNLVGLITQTDITRAYFKFYSQLPALIEHVLQLRTQNLVNANEQLLALSLEDPLLNIGNRRAMEVDLEHTHASSLRYRRTYSVALFDIDYFKSYNDHYGHPEGDRILKTIASSLNGCIRKADRLYRYGGEELLMLCPETPIEGVRIMAERLIAVIESLAITHVNSPSGVVTISGGIANRGEHQTWKELVNEADQALYAAKRAGRNRLHAINRA